MAVLRCGFVRGRHRQRTAPSTPPFRQRFPARISCHNPRPWLLKDLSPWSCSLSLSLWKIGSMGASSFQRFSLWSCRGSGSAVAVILAARYPCCPLRGLIWDRCLFDWGAVAVILGLARVRVVFFLQINTGFGLLPFSLSLCLPFAVLRSAAWSACVACPAIGVGTSFGSPRRRWRRRFPSVLLGLVVFSAP